jgi:hypothetical protein
MATTNTETPKTENQNIITIKYDSIKDKIKLKEDKIKQINQQGSLPINKFVETADLQGVVATVSIPPNGNLSITEIKIGDQQIYHQQQGGRKSTRRGKLNQRGESTRRVGGRKTSRRGVGRKSRRRHNYI